jgi:hypothetical protein
MSEIIVTCATNADATVDKDGFCTAHGNDCADYAQSLRAGRTVKAYLSDGSHIKVPRRDAVKWGREAAELDTTMGLGDWYTDEGNERQNEIQGKPKDDPRCDHLHQEDTPADIKRARVTNASQADGYDASRNHASAWVCSAPACILDGLAWVQRATGETAVWIDEAGVKHTALPQAVSDLEFPLDQAAATLLMDENGFATFTIALDKWAFLNAAASAHKERIIEDFVHEQVLSFGYTYDSRAEPVAIDGESIIVAYTTNVAEALKMEQEVS